MTFRQPKKPTGRGSQPARPGLTRPAPKPPAKAKRPTKAKRSAKKNPAQARRRRWPWVVLGVLIFMLLAGAGGLYAGYTYFTYDLPKLDKLSDYRPKTISYFYAKDGTPIAEFFDERREVVPIHRLPQNLINAFVAAEDSEFFTHPGVNLKAIFRAAIRNLEAGRLVQGGSTITQQVTKSFLLSPEKSFRRKIREALLAYRIDKRFSKNEILYLYLNQIYLGTGAYGVAAAADVYFGKKVEQLSLAECAMLAGLPQAPSRYSPRKHFQRARERQLYVLGRMVEDGYITAEAARQASDEEIFIDHSPIRMTPKAPYFVEHVRRLVEEKIGPGKLATEGLKVYTTLDLFAQQAAEKAVAQGMEDLDKREGFRGPLRRIPAGEIATEIGKLGQANPVDSLTPGRKAEALVMEVRDDRVRLNLGTMPAEMILKENRWARPRNPDIAYYRAKLKSFKEILKTGDLVLVELEKPQGRGQEGLWSVKLSPPPMGQAALVSMEASSGHVLAMVGGRDYNDSQFNRATQAMRQPGSAFKPFIYAAALDKGYTTASVFLDAPVVYSLPGTVKPWKPKNYSQKFYGPTTMRVALEKSRNVVTVKILDRIGPQYVVDYAKKLGFTSELSPILSLALGTSEVTVLEMVRAYSTFCNMGLKTEPVFITRIEDRSGQIIEESSLNQERVMDPVTAYITTSMMEGVVQHGTAWRLKALKKPVAGKTGTTNDLRDAWFAGFSPDIVTVVWAGYDDHSNMGKGETGSRTASPIWLDYMKEVLANRPVKDFQVPEGVVFARIDKKSGLLAPPGDRNAILESFKKGTVPTERVQTASTVPGTVSNSRGRNFLMMEGEDVN